MREREHECVSEMACGPDTEREEPHVNQAASRVWARGAASSCASRPARVEAEPRVDSRATVCPSSLGFGR